MNDDPMSHDYEKFDAEWRRLEKEGACDGFGGAEYDRVLGEYGDSDGAENIEAFIRRRANAGPDG